MSNFYHKEGTEATVSEYVRCYGAGRLAKNVADMTGKEPSIFFTFSWKFSAPCLIAVINKDLHFDFNLISCLFVDNLGFYLARLPHPVLQQGPIHLPRVVPLPGLDCHFSILSSSASCGHYANCED